LTYLAVNLRFSLAIVPREILEWSITRKATIVFGDVTLITTEYWLDGFVIALFVVVDKISPFPVLLIGNDFRELINLEFLIFGRMRVIKNPLFKRDVSADKI